MWLERYLIINARGRCRIAKRHPSLRDDEIMLSLSLRLPDSLFKKPIIEAKIEIPEDAVTPAALDAEVLASAREALEKVIGMRVELVPVLPKTTKEGDL